VASLLIRNSLPDSIRDVLLAVIALDRPQRQFVRKILMHAVQQWFYDDALYISFILLICGSPLCCQEEYLHIIAAMHHVGRIL